MLELRIGQHTYVITPEDRFMDNCVRIQLLTQSRESTVWGRRVCPVLSKNAVAEIDAFTRVERKHGYAPTVRVFSLAPR